MQSRIRYGRDHDDLRKAGLGMIPGKTVPVCPRETGFTTFPDHALESRTRAPSQLGDQVEEGGKSQMEWLSEARQWQLSPAGNPFDFGLDDPLHQGREIIIEPGFQHRTKHFLDQVFQRPRIVAEHRMGKRVERGFDGRDR
jgi:hypothetical protein